MTVSELRTGNYVKCWGDIYKICSIHQGGNLRVRVDDTYNPETTGISNVEPIPLTEEWLLKFGFEKDATDWWYTNDFGLKKYDDDSFEFYHYSVSIEYVHQLQNLYFALTGEELTPKQ